MEKELTVCHLNFACLDARTLNVAFLFLGFAISIHPSSSYAGFYLTQGCMYAGAFYSCVRVKVGSPPWASGWFIAGLTKRIGLPSALAFTPTDKLELPVSPLCMSLEGGSNPE